MSETPSAPSGTPPLFLAQCRCGKVQIQSSQPPFLQLTCHCQDCRQVSKRPFTHFAFFKLAFTQVQGELQTHTFTADSGATTYRQTCAACGDMVIDRTDGFPKLIGVVAECIRPPYVFEPRCHVWVDSKLPEVQLPEGTKAFARAMA